MAKKAKPGEDKPSLILMTKVKFVRGNGEEVVELFENTKEGNSRMARAMEAFEDSLPDPVRREPVETELLEEDQISRILLHFQNGGDEFDAAMAAELREGQLDEFAELWKGLKKKRRQERKLQKAMELEDQKRSQQSDANL
jgi:hypothetical protein